jgi:hypothetical protein
LGAVTEVGVCLQYSQRGGYVWGVVKEGGKVCLQYRQSGWYVLGTVHKEDVFYVIGRERYNLGTATDGGWV